MEFPNTPFDDSHISEEREMKKETIITDATTYIRELQTNVNNLSEQLLAMEATHKEELETRNEEIIDKWGIEPEVQVAQIGTTNKLWIKIVCQKKRGGFTELMEAMNVFGFDLNDTSVTTSKGALLVTSSVEVVCGGITEANQIREMSLTIILGI
ncbi:hypothetical protein RND71_034224 [Anisodus tanguticus]|uniref:Plant bHLH transcription factor ACT-like domain-containing protein n=1 Tax=Anisodus tanguticus TaxID=243964 RepID=A0AAE1R975_9SOLA|nr:hypothetical protein RND71_034224 [Anisodus tanguticus]